MKMKEMVLEMLDSESFKELEREDELSEVIQEEVTQERGKYRVFFRLSSDKDLSGFVERVNVREFEEDFGLKDVRVESHGDMNEVLANLFLPEEICIDDFVLLFGQRYGVKMMVKR